MAFQIKRPATAFSLDPTDKSQKRIHDPAHLAFIRTLPSVISGLIQCEACHIRSGSPQHRKKRTGGQQKPDDSWCLPLTPEEHRQQHGMNELEFYKRHGIDDPFSLALAIYAVTGDETAATTIIRKSRQSRRHTR